MNSQGREIREPDDRGIGYNRKTEETENRRTRESENQRTGKPDNRKARQPESQRIGKPKDWKVRESENQITGKPQNRKATEPESQNELLRVCKGGSEWQKKQRTLETGNTKVTYSR